MMTMTIIVTHISTQSNPTWLVWDKDEIHSVNDWFLSIHLYCCLPISIKFDLFVSTWMYLHQGFRMTLLDDIACRKSEVNLKMLALSQTLAKCYTHNFWQLKQISNVNFQISISKCKTCLKQNFLNITQCCRKCVEGKLIQVVHDSIYR